MLEVKNLTAGYGGKPVLHGLSVTVEPGTVVAILGVNGSGKSTLLRAISGLTRDVIGEVIVDGQVITRRKPHEMAKLGIAHCLEGGRVFPHMTVLENLELAGNGAKPNKGSALTRVFGLFPVLEQRKRLAAGKLSGGERQMLCLGQALVQGCRYVLLDEVSAGLSPVMADSIGGVVREMRSSGVGILWAEQNARVALRFSDSCILLQSGEVSLRGKSKDLMANEVVGREYLGTATVKTDD